MENNFSLHLPDKGEKIVQILSLYLNFKKCAHTHTLLFIFHRDIAVIV